MNRLQRIFLVCGLVGVVCLCLFPPWDCIITLAPKNFDFEKAVREGMSALPAEPWLELPACKHGWILDPSISGLRSRTCSVRVTGIAFSRLGLEAGAVAGMTAIAVVLAGWRKKARPSN